MGNCVRRLSGGRSEETVMSAAGPSAKAGVTSNFHKALEECNSSSLDAVALGDCPSGAGSSMEPKSEYFSPRIAKMMKSKKQFSSDVEHKIEHSRAHWTEMSGPCDFSEDSKGNEEMMQKYYEEANRENAEVFTELMNDPQWKQDPPWEQDPESSHKVKDFFLEWSPRWKLGPKIAEGAQGEIFEVTVDDGIADSKFLLKVFKRGTRLSDLRKQWPCGILRREVACVVNFGFKLDDGRFGFGMLKCWGDLRMLIDEAMMKKNNQHPPFPYEWSGVIWHAKHVMLRIAFHMEMLHKNGIIHRDLKAANILFYANDKVLDPKTTTISEMLSDRSIFVADFECSLGVVGTRFWRAPEILLGLKKETSIDFPEKTDVYSYAMTCFEIVTGRLPFEIELEVGPISDDLVIAGQRPKLPSDLDVKLKDLIERCWNGDPIKRPSFSEIYEVLAS